MFFFRFSEKYDDRSFLLVGRSRTRGATLVSLYLLCWDPCGCKRRIFVAHWGLLGVVCDFWGINERGFAEVRLGKLKLGFWSGTDHTIDDEVPREDLEGLEIRKNLRELILRNSFAK